jgi:hypothetical protein
MHYPSHVLRSCVEDLKAETAVCRPVDLKNTHPHVISIFLDLVAHDNNRLSSITNAEQYLQVKAFAERYAIGRLNGGLQFVRTKVKENDPFGFMKILVDEATSYCQAKDIEEKVGEFTRHVQALSQDHDLSIETKIWTTLNEGLVSFDLSSARPKDKGEHTARTNKLTPDTVTQINQGITNILADIRSSYANAHGMEKAQHRVYRSDEMRETILALRHHFYVTSENHFPAHWTSYTDTPYCNMVVEYDTPAHALPTHIAAALGMPFYRAFTFSLDQALLYQNFRSGYTRAPEAPPPFIREGNSSDTVEPIHIGSLTQESQGISTQLASPMPRTATPTQMSLLVSYPSPAPEPCATPFQTPGADGEPSSQPLSTFESNSAVPPASCLDRLDNPILRAPTPTPTPTRQSTEIVTQDARKSSRKKATDFNVKQEEEGETVSMPGRRDDQVDEGEELWMDIWNCMGKHLPIGES